MLGLQVADNFSFKYISKHQLQILIIHLYILYIVLLIIKLLNISSGRTLPLIGGVKQHKI